MKPRRGTLILLLTVSLCSVAPLTAQVAGLEQHPGYFPLEELGVLTPESLSLEVNLSGTMLELIASALDDEDPRFAELMRGLVGIRVRIAGVENLDLAALRTGFDHANSWFGANGWETFVRIRDDDEELYVFMKVMDGEMVGTTLLALEPGEDVVVVNVVGELDLTLLASLAESLDIPQLDVAGLGAEDSTPADKENQ